MLKALKCKLTIYVLYCGLKSTFLTQINQVACIKSITCREGGLDFNTFCCLDILASSLLDSLDNDLLPS